MLWLNSATDYRTQPITASFRYILYEQADITALSDERIPAMFRAQEIIDRTVIIQDWESKAVNSSNEDEQNLMGVRNIHQPKYNNVERYQNWYINIHPQMASLQYL